MTSCAARPDFVDIATTVNSTTLPAPIRFVPVDVLIDPQGKPLACYEVEIVATRGRT